MPPFSNTNIIYRTVKANRAFQDRGAYSVCSAHPTVLRAAVQTAANTRTPLIIESTCNQVNQFGGYTGLKPAQFVELIQHLQLEQNLSSDQLLLGGDHLGPNPWRHESAEIAMAKAKVLIRDYITAGYRKIHLDTSMQLADDDQNDILSASTAAIRSASLAMEAERSYAELDDGSEPPIYIIGTEVPTPGGSTRTSASIQVTPVESARETLTLSKRAFHEIGLHSAWDRVLGLVVQPGVEFGDQELHLYNRAAALDLKDFIETQPHFVFEAHSTDYQPQPLLTQLVEDHFAILKVGPALTFAYREAIFALAHIEREILGNRYEHQGSHISATLERRMKAKPEYWIEHYQGSEEERRIARRFSLSDRIRYYWTEEGVLSAVTTLKQNLKNKTLPPGLVRQYFHQEPYNQSVELTDQVWDDLVLGRIAQTIMDYVNACHPHGEGLQRI